MNNLIVRNESNMDRIIRVVVGLVLIILPLINADITALLLIPGVILLATGLLGTCLIYRVFGFSTCPVETPKK